MKWTEHETKANRDPRMEKLLAKHGGPGYGVYWFIVELIGEPITSGREDNGYLPDDVDTEYIALRMRMDEEDVQAIIDGAVAVGLLQRVDGRLFCRAILSRCDSYTRKKMAGDDTDSVRRVSAECTDSVRTVSVDDTDNDGTESVHPSICNSSSLSVPTPEEERDDEKRLTNIEAVYGALQRGYAKRNQRFNPMSEDRHIREIAELALSDPDPPAWLRRFIETAERCHESHDLFKGKPFLPHIHMGPKLGDHLLAAMDQEQDDRTIRPVQVGAG